MDNKEAIEYLLYMKHNVEARSPMDIAIDTAIESLKAQTVNRWISCSDRMPVRYDPVMILTDDGSYAIAYTTPNEDEYLWFGDGGHYSKDCVLFWMPLPEPPEKE